MYLYNYGDFDRAIIWYNKALKRDPELIPAKWFKAEILLRDGRVKEGLDLLNEALNQNPNVTQFLTLKHVALMMLGNYEEAYNFILNKKENYTNESSLLRYYQAVGLSLLYLKRFGDLEKIIDEISTTPNSNRTHHKQYLTLLKHYENADYQRVIDGFEELDNTDLFSSTKGARRTLSDVFYYWRSKSYLEIGDYQNALKETFKFRAASNQITGQTVFDQFWPKKNYLKGIAYEGLGDIVNAIESYEDFLRLWKNADSYLPEIIDAKKRLENLK